MSARWLARAAFFLVLAAALAETTNWPVSQPWRPGVRGEGRCWSST